MITFDKLDNCGLHLPFTSTSKKTPKHTKEKTKLDRNDTLGLNCAERSRIEMSSAHSHPSCFQFSKPNWKGVIWTLTCERTFTKWPPLLD